MPESLTLVIPVFNSVDTLEALHASLTETAGTLAPLQYEIIYVDDGSRDASFSVIERIAASDPHAAGIRLRENCGQQHALLCGIRHASGTYIVTIDDDMQYPPRYIPKLLTMLKQGYEVVYGIPRQRSGSRLRNLGTFLTRVLLQLVCMKPQGIEVSSYRIMTRELAVKVSADKRAKVYISATTFLHTDKAANISIETVSTGGSRFTLTQLIQTFFHIFFQYAPLFRRFQDRRKQYIIERKIHL